MLDRLNQRHLRCFVEIVRQGSLIGAAERLSVSQSAISKTLRELEHIIGERLLERHRGGIALTPAGEIFHRYASASLTAVREGLELIARNRPQTQSGVLVGALPTAAAWVLPAAVERFKARFSSVPVEIVSGSNRELLARLRLGEVDFVVGRLAESQEMVGLRFERLFLERLALVVRPGHPLENTTVLDGDMATGQTIILPAQQTVIRGEAERFLISHGLDRLANVIETNSVEFARAYAMGTDAVWIVPYGIVETDIREGRLRPLPLELGSTEGPVGITTRWESGIPDHASRLMDMIREMASSLEKRRQLYGKNIK